MAKHHEEKFQALIMKKSKNDIKNRIILKYATTHSHPQPPKTIRNHSQSSATTHNHPNHPQPSTTIQDFSKRPTATHNHPQPPTTIQKSTHKHPQNHHNNPKLSTTTQKLPKKAKTCQKQLCSFTLDVDTETDVAFDNDMKQWYICMYVCVCMCVSLYFISHYTYYFLVKLIVCFCQHYK